MSELPPRSTYPGADIDFAPRFPAEEDVSVEQRANGIVLIEVSFARILPRDERWSPNPVWIGVGKSGRVALQGLVFGENFDPQPFQLEFISEPNRRAMTLQDLEDAEREVDADD